MKSKQRTLIESMLRDGLHSMRAIARIFGISAARVSTINKEMHRPTRAEVRELWNVDEVMKKPSTAQGHGWIL